MIGVSMLRESAECVSSVVNAFGTNRSRFKVRSGIYGFTARPDRGADPIIQTVRTSKIRESHLRDVS